MWQILCIHIRAWEHMYERKTRTPDMRTSLHVYITTEGGMERDFLFHKILELSTNHSSLPTSLIDFNQQSLRRHHTCHCASQQDLCCLTGRRRRLRDWWALHFHPCSRRVVMQRLNVERLNFKSRGTHRAISSSSSLWQLLSFSCSSPGVLLWAPGAVKQKNDPLTRRAIYNHNS